MNWIDWVLIVFLAISVGNGLQEGMVRIGIGFFALIAAFLLASWFGGMAAGSLMPWVHSAPVAKVAGYLLIFCGVIIAGALIAALLARMLKIIGLSWIDRLLGAAFGVVRGFLIIAVVMMVVTALVPKWLPDDLNRSTLAPYFLRASKVLTAMTPFDIRDGFERAMRELRSLKPGSRD